MKNDLRYTISMKGDYKIFYSVCSILAVIMAVMILSFSWGKCKSFIHYGVVVFLELFWIGIAGYGFYLLKKKVRVFKEIIVYQNLFQKKELKLSDISSVKSINKEIDYGTSTDFGVSNDKVTSFYNNQGKKLFTFGLAYENVSLLVKDVKKNNKLS